MVHVRRLYGLDDLALREIVSSFWSLRDVEWSSIDSLSLVVPLAGQSLSEYTQAHDPDESLSAAMTEKRGFMVWR